MSTPEKTNILFILTDDQGVWAAGCYGNPEIRPAGQVDVMMSLFHPQTLRPWQHFLNMRVYGYDQEGV